MAVLHPATLTPSKLEMLSAYLPTQTWFTGYLGLELSTLGAYRFDDPAGEVGIETHLLATSSGAVLQMPLTYRDAPMSGADAWLLGTMEHSVLGRRWVYNASPDPIYARELATMMLAGGSQARLLVETDDGPVEREPSITLSGSGNPGQAVPTIESVEVTLSGSETSIRAGELELVVRHVIDEVIDDVGPSEPRATLVGSWPDSNGPALLAFIR